MPIIDKITNNTCNSGKNNTTALVDHNYNNCRYLHIKLCKKYISI